MKPIIIDNQWFNFITAVFNPAIDSILMVKFVSIYTTKENILF